MYYNIFIYNLIIFIFNYHNYFFSNYHSVTHFIVNINKCWRHATAFCHPFCSAQILYFLFSLYFSPEYNSSINLFFQSVSTFFIIFITTAKFILLNFFPHETIYINICLLSKSFSQSHYNPVVSLVPFPFLKTNWLSLRFSCILFYLKLF